MCCWPRVATSAPASSPSIEHEQMITHDQPGTSEAVRAAARELDYDRYLAALLAPARARDGLMALAAFHGEIARIPLTVREPGVGDIRLQWWRDALATPAAIATGNPVADAMRDVVRAQALPVDTLVGDDRRLRAAAGGRRFDDRGGGRRARRGDPGRDASARRADCGLRRPRDASAAARGRASGRTRAAFCARCRRSSPRDATRSATQTWPRWRHRCCGKPRPSWRGRANSPRPRRQPSCP